MSEPDFGEAIRAQPANLREAARAFDDAVGDADLAGFANGTLVLSGIGASYYALAAAVWVLRTAGRRAYAVRSSELTAAREARLGDAYVLVSQSGASTETLEAVEALDDAPLIAVSARGDSPLAQAATLWVPLGPLPDTTVATLSYTATVQSLGMLCDSLLDRDRGDWYAVPDRVEQLLTDCAEAVGSLVSAFTRIRTVDAVGGGGSAGSAEEAALMTREALKLPALGLETRDYLHGPLEPVGPGFGCIVLGGEREHALAASLAGWGADVLLISDRGSVEHPSGVTTVKLPEVSDLARPILEILPVQLLVERVAHERGLMIGPLARHQTDTKVALS